MNTLERYFRRKLKDSLEDSNITKSTERIPILEYNPNIRDQVQRAYAQNGPCQPREHKFPLTQFGKQSRKFNVGWFDEYGNWLEYNIAKDGTFCFCCYILKPNIGEQAGGDSFVGKGFTNFKKKNKLRKHFGGPYSAHNQAWKKCEALKNQKQHLDSFFAKRSENVCSEYQSCLNASVDCVRFLFRQWLAFHGDDESENSSNRGNFRELLQLLADHDDDSKAVTLENAPENLKLTSPGIQKDIVSAAAARTTDVIMKDIGDAMFSILVDESHDISMKEQIVVVLCYVDKNGCVIKRAVGVEHVASTRALSLKIAIGKLFCRHRPSISRLRGQGYDGASNMQGGFNGLETLVLKENPSAFYVHCFSHQLQLALVAVAKKHIQVASLFTSVASLVNGVGASSKRCDILREKQEAIISKAIKDGEISSGRGLKQETTLKRHGDTCWGSHYGTLLSLITMFSSVIDVLEIVADDGTSSEQRLEANNLLELMLSFDFVFSLHLMKTLLGATNELSKALKRKDQDIVNAMSLVKICWQRLQSMRDNG